MKRLLKWLVTLALLGGAGYGIYLKVKPEPPLVIVQVVARGTVTDTVSGVAMGVVEPARRVTVQAEAVARVKEVRVKRGQRVQVGDVLVVLNDADVQDQIRSLRAAIPALELRVQQGRTRLTQLQSEQGRARKLYDKGIVPQAQLDSATFGKDVAAIEGDAARAALQQARVNLDVARAALRKTVVRAPFAGLVLDVFAQVGEQATGLGTGSTSGGAAAIGGAGGAASALAAASSKQTGLVDLADDREMFVFVDVDEMDYGKLALRQLATLTVDALGKRKLSGAVVEIFPYVSRAADQNRTVRVKIRLPESARGVALPGMSANVDVLVGKRENVLLLPSYCVLTRPAGKAALKIVGELLQEVPLRTGTTTWDQTVIEGGLVAGDRVAVPSGEARLADGMRVRLKEPAANGRAGPASAGARPNGGAAASAEAR